VRVALYVPPIPDENRTPQLGPLYLLAVLEQHGFDGRLFDARIDGRAFSQLLDFKPELVGVSAVTPGYLGGCRLRRSSKKSSPASPLSSAARTPPVSPWRWWLNLRWIMCWWVRAK
jgi:hypothetical protein